MVTDIPVSIFLTKTERPTIGRQGWVERNGRLMELAVAQEKQ